MGRNADTARRPDEHSRQTGVCGRWAFAAHVPRTRCDRFPTLLANSEGMDKAAGVTPTLLARPRRATVICWIAAAAVVAVCASVAGALQGATEGGGVFHAADRYTMVGLGIVLGAAVMLFARPAVWVSDQGIRVRNIVGSYNLPWDVVTAVSFPPGASWVQLEVADGDVISVMAIQAVDKEHAVAAVRKLRAALAENQETAAPA